MHSFTLPQNIDLGKSAPHSGDVSMKFRRSFDEVTTKLESLPPSFDETTKLGILPTISVPKGQNRLPVDAI
jgi:hypothetical protein